VIDLYEISIPGSLGFLGFYYSLLWLDFLFLTRHCFYWKLRYYLKNSSISYVMIISAVCWIDFREYYCGFIVVVSLLVIVFDGLAILWLWW